MGKYKGCGIATLIQMTSLKKMTRESKWQALPELSKLGASNSRSS
jgi:hypothetical protein